MLEVIANLFIEQGEDRKLSFHDVFNGVEALCRKMFMPKIQYSEMDCVMEVLQNYNIIEIERAANKKDSKVNKFTLKVELEELRKALQQ